MYEYVTMSLGNGATIAMGPQPNSDQDFEKLAEFAPDHFVTLTETKEWQLDDFEIRARAVTNNWHHHPVRDFTAANESINPLLDTLLNALQSGGKIFIHCRGGCGRTGMLVMRLQIMLGDAPKEALETLRAVRPCAVETKEQEIWASFGLNQD